MICIVGNRAAPERVVDEDQTAGAHQGVAALVVGEEIFLVGIDERHVETPALGLGKQGIECAQGRSQAEFDLVRNASLLPMALGGLGDLGIDIAGEDLAVWVQGKCDRQRAVTGIGADLEIAPNTEQGVRASAMKCACSGASSM